MNIIFFIKFIIYDIYNYNLIINNNGNILNYPIFQIDEYKNYFDIINKNYFSNICWNKYDIENIFLLIVILPFLKVEIHIANNLYIKNFFRHIFNKKNNEVIMINNNTIADFSDNCRRILNYKWEYLPSRNKTNYIRHILYHYYTEDCLKAYEDSLNMNIKNYIELKKDNLNYNEIKDLISKNYFL